VQNTIKKRVLRAVFALPQLSLADNRQHARNQATTLDDLTRVPCHVQLCFQDFLNLTCRDQRDILNNLKEFNKKCTRNAQFLVEKSPGNATQCARNAQFRRWQCNSMRTDLVARGFRGAGPAAQADPLGVAVLVRVLVRNDIQ
jgi:hypothetical protein